MVVEQGDIAVRQTADVVLKRKGEARTLLESWRERSGVGMWTVANYVNSLTGMLTRPKLIDPDQIACAMPLPYRVTQVTSIIGNPGRRLSP